MHILLLPEMAFSGYCFDDVADVSRVAETDDGPTVRWCAKHAVRLGCTVLCGYPRRVPGAKIPNEGVAEAVADAGADALYNALVAVGPDGNTLTHYHKSFLYVVDKTWADEGSGFVCVDVPVRRAPLGGEGGGVAEGTESGAREYAFVRATLGVCMDINPREFEAPWEAYELATAAKAHASSLVLFASAWTNNHPDDDPATVAPVDPRGVMTYWLSRLAPLVGAGSFDEQYDATRFRGFIAAGSGASVGFLLSWMSMQAESGLGDFEGPLSSGAEPAGHGVHSSALPRPVLLE